jgi:hypothetical protein
VPRKPRTVPAKAAAPQFDDAPLDSDDEEGACPIPDEHGEVVLRRSKTTTEGTKRGKAKGSCKKPAG